MTGHSVPLRQRQTGRAPICTVSPFKSPKRNPQTTRRCIAPADKMPAPADKTDDPWDEKTREKFNRYAGWPLPPLLPSSQREWTQLTARIQQEPKRMA